MQNFQIIKSYSRRELEKMIKDHTVSSSLSASREDDLIVEFRTVLDEVVAVDVMKEVANAH